MTLPAWLSRAIARRRAANHQEQLWAGKFGDDYTERNRGAQWLERNRVFFARILAAMDPPFSVLELGAGSGSNLAAIKLLDREIETTGVEINTAAYADLERVADIAIQGSFLGFTGTNRKWDVVFTKGVLIHVAPEDLLKAYQVMYTCSSRYLLVCEYYSPRAEEIPYRGHKHALWKRDFAGELMGLWSDLRLVDYGFTYHRDTYPQDDLTWFLLEKTDPVRRHP